MSMEGIKESQSRDFEQEATYTLRRDILLAIVSKDGSSSANLDVQVPNTAITHIRAPDLLRDHAAQ